jgi:sensor histidine kinase YesM
MSEIRNFSPRLLVNREIQGRMLRRLALYWMGYHLILWHALFFAEWVQMQINAIAVGRSVSLLHAYAAFVGSQYLLPLVALAMFPLVLWDMLKLTHRIAGPLVQLRNRLHDMSNGCPPQKVHFRHGDMLSEIQDAFNAWVDSVEAEPNSPEELFAQSEEQYARLIQQVKALQEALKPPTKDEAESAAADAALEPQAETQPA